MTLRRALKALQLPVSALALGAGYVYLLLSTVRTLGYARDEGFYFQAASAYGRWFELLFTNAKAALDPRVVDSAWSANHEHPGLIKSLFALSSTYLGQKYHVFAMEGTSYRFPAMALAGLAVGIVFLWGAQFSLTRRGGGRGEGKPDWLAGIVAAVSLAAMPRFFFQAHLACFDIPIVAVWVLTYYAYWRSLRDGGFFWPLFTGLCFGLALDTKHNSWFLPIATVSHYLALEAWAIASSHTPLGSFLKRPPAPGRMRRRAIAALAAMAVAGPVVFYELWPWLWHDTWARLWAYSQFHRNHEYYNMEFLGRNYWAAPMPRLCPWLMTLATVPAVTLILFAAGLGRTVLGLLQRPKQVSVASVSKKKSSRKPRRGAKIEAPDGVATDGALTELLWLFGFGVNYAAWLSTSTPIFGGTKHWMTAYPFLALFAGYGFSQVVRVCRLELFRNRTRATIVRELAGAPALVSALLVVSVLAAPIAEALHAHPWGLSTYTPLVGGAPGGATLGLNRGFWGYQTGAIADWLNARAPRGSSVYIHDTAGQSWDMFLRDGRIRRDLRAVWSIAGADYGIYHHEMHMLGQEYQNWVAFGTVRPAHIGGLDGVPVILVYEDPRISKGLGKP